MDTKYSKLLSLGNTLIISGSILTGFGAPQIAEIIIFDQYIDITYIGIPTFIIGLILSIIAIKKNN